jgi:hypothetical protein
MGKFGMVRIDFSRIVLISVDILIAQERRGAPDQYSDPGHFTSSVSEIANEHFKGCLVTRT